MYEIKYAVALNEDGRPCIELDDDYEHRPEDKFFAIEIARYYLQMVEANMDDTIYDQQTLETMDIAIRLLGQVGDEMAVLQYENMRSQGQITMMMDRRFHMTVYSIEERDALPDKNILYRDKIFDRVEGLKVCVETRTDDGVFHCDYFELKDGITNEHWVKI